MSDRFIYFQCPECEFDSVQLATFTGSTECPLCAGDSGHSVMMRRRPATEADKPEGRDAREQAERLEAGTRVLSGAEER